MMPTSKLITAVLELEKSINCGFLYFIFQSYAQPSLQYIQGQQIFTAHPQGVVVQPAAAVTTIVAPGQPQPLQPVRNISVDKVLVGCIPHLQKVYFWFWFLFLFFSLCVLFLTFIVSIFTQVLVYLRKHYSTIFLKILWNLQQC